MAIRFQSLLTPIPGFFSTFPRGTDFSIGLETYLALEVDSSHSDLVSSRPYSGTRQNPSSYCYGTITLYGITFQETSHSRTRVKGGPQNHISAAFQQRIQFGLCGVHSLLLTAYRLISFPAGTKMFQFPAFPLRQEHPRRDMKSYSEIPGSKPACGSPGLYRCLPRPSSAFQA